MQDLTIIILTYNSSHIISSCLNNIDLNKYRVIIVDNASSDNTIEVIKSNYPQLEIIKIANNGGYGRGNNVALRQVKSDFALVLNPDAIISDDDIQQVLQVIKSDEKVAIAGPLIIENSVVSDEMISKEKSRIEKDFCTIKDMYYDKIGRNYDSRFISGACIFLRMSVFRKIGFFDENIFLFYEDDELCLRARRNGYKNLTVTDALVCHVGASSSKKTWRGIYRRNRHLKGWSKLYWKQIKRGKLGAKRSALRLTFLYFIKSIISLLKLDLEEMVQNLGSCSGSISYLIGLGAFKKDGTPRG